MTQNSLKLLMSSIMKQMTMNNIMIQCLTLSMKKTDNGNGVSDVIAEQIVTNFGNEKVIVAPTDAGKFMNYESNVNIEEKCFPHLFPKGVVGYMSTYLPQKVWF